MDNAKLREIIYNYNERLGVIVPLSKKSDSIFSYNNALIDIASLSTLIDTSEKLSMKINLIPIDNEDLLLNYDETSVLNILNYEEDLDSWFRQLAFYPKFNTSFSKIMHVPVIKSQLLDAGDEIKSVFRFPIEVIYYFYFGDKLVTEKRFYNSSFFFDETAYNEIPPFILSKYNFDDFFEHDDFETPVDSSFFEQSRSFKDSTHFAFIIDDPDIRSQTKYIPFFEVRFTVTSSPLRNADALEQQILSQNFSSMDQFSKFVDFYLVMKDVATGEVYLRKITNNKASFRKIFYNIDYINFKNRIVK